MITIHKYLPDKLFGFVFDSETNNQYFFHLKVFKPGPWALMGRCLACDRTCQMKQAPLPIIGEPVDVVLSKHLKKETDKVSRVDSVIRLEIPKRIFGTVEKYEPSLGYGYILGEDGIRYHLHKCETSHQIFLSGQEVVFYSGQRQSKPRACYVRSCLNKGN